MRLTTLQRRFFGVLLAAAGVAAGARWLAHEDARQRAVAGLADARAHLLACDPNDPVVGLELMGPAGTRVLRREGTGPWRLQAPIAAPADADIVTAVLDASCALKSMGEVRAKSGEPELDLGMFGLQPPSQGLTLQHASGATQHLAVGDRLSFDKSLYVRRRQDGPVERIDGAYSYQLERDVLALRDKRVLPAADAVRVTRVVLASASPQARPFVLERHEARDALHVPPDGPAVAADGARADELVEALTQLRAQSFVAEPADAAARRRFGLAPPHLVATLSWADGSSHALRIGRLQLGDTVHHFAQVDDDAAPIVQLPGDWAVQKLVEGAQRLRDMRVLHVEASDVRRMVVRDGARTLTLEQRVPTDGAASSWHLVPGADVHASPSDGARGASPAAGLPVDSARLATLVQQLTQMRAAELEPGPVTAARLAAAGLQGNARHVELQGEGGRMLGTLWIGRTQGPHTLVTDDKKEVLSLVFSAALADLSASADAYVLPPMPDDHAQAG